MRKILLPTGEIVFASEETYGEYAAHARTHGTTLKEAMRIAIEGMFQGRLPDEVKRFYSSWRAKNPGVAILDAHGHRHGNTWFYRDGGLDRRVQDWVSSVDGSYGTLVLLVCDQCAYSNVPETRESLIFIPDSAVVGGMLAQLDGAHHFSVIHPAYGEIDAYVAEHARTELLGA